ncbi:Alpha-amylase/pullulanase [Anaerohalosphaera lusitana]|uniref:Alpha-amylase/pullulanase n=1 Tax=Anaerohalosphaera lusitana TaxID=1936003 RepID=A0A1U9NGQ5_9BACT|nr:LamG-like jellyroll fold domain-containing protein [Anaerohalosphaera lusitana]AQT67121.1 Alpha-amylase/pullulanase [Anaerohalosphaera lusitana]
MKRFSRSSFSKVLVAGFVMLFVFGSAVFAVDPANPPEFMRVEVERGGEVLTFNLDRYNMRGENFEVVLLDTDGVTQIPLDPGPVRTYRGWCEEEPDSYVEATLMVNGDLRYHVFKGAAYDWWYDPPYERDDTAGAVNNFTEIGGTPVQPAGTVYPGASFTLPAANLDDYYKTVYQMDFGTDVLVEYVDAANFSNLLSYVRKAENAVGHYNGLYVRDILAEAKLGKVVYRQSNAGVDRSSAQWGVDWWNANSYFEQLFPDADHHFITMVGSVGGGVAFVCDYGGIDWAGRSFNGWNGDYNWWHVGRHEVGHNMGAGDWDGGGREGATMMNGNNVGISRVSNASATRIMNCRRNKVSGGVDIRNIGAYGYPVPPYANLDMATALVGSSVALDVLGNDYDANNDQLAISDFQQESPNGGSVVFSAGTGPDGRDELIYTPPTNSVGEDKFTYSIVDESGRTAMGYVIMSVDLDDTIKGYYPLDEMSGTVADDVSIFDNNGSLVNGASFDADSVAGVFGGGLDLDGVDDHIEISSLNLNSNTVTITAWVKPNGSPTGWNGIVFNRSQNAAGLNFGTGGELRYHWDGTNWGWNSGLVPTVGQWNFVALVVEPDRATIYLSDGATVQSATNVNSHGVQSFGGTTYIGLDSNSGSRHFKGSVDDVRVYNYSMNADEIGSVIAGGQVECPSPLDGATNVGETYLSWVQAADVLGYDVYLGTDATAVAAAGTDSPEYRGQVTDAVFDVFELLETNTQYFWRVDTVTSEGVISGVIWEFTTGSALGMTGYWKLDDGDGTVADDSSGGNNDGTVSGAVWTQGVDGGALSFDGVNDAVRFGTGPSLSGKTDFSVSAWIKTSASKDQVIVQQRNGGFNGQYAVRVNYDGRVSFFVYGNMGYQFSFSSSETVNDGEWHHVAAVRDGDDGFIYIDGSLSGSGSGSVRDLNGGIGVGVGADIRDNNKHFQGVIDEVRIYDRALGGDAVHELFYELAEKTDAPVGLTATAGDGWINLDWENGAGYPTYTVYRSTTSGSGYEVIAPTAVLSMYSDGTVVNGIEYYYVVTATDSGGVESEFSNEVGAAAHTAGDVNADGFVDLSDLAMLSEYWLQDCSVVPCGEADTDDSGYVDFDDLSAIAVEWLNQ